jgi:formylglycine-generating enzyme required for sulfatase activity
MAKAFKIKRLFVVFVISIGALTLTTIGIDAVDHLNNFSNSIIGSIFMDKTLQSPCPEDMVYIISTAKNFCLDKFENSLADQCPIQNIMSQEDTSANLNESDCKPVSVKNAYPWVNISQDQAREACAKAGKRLASVEEWSAAVLGTPDKDADWTEDDCQVASNWADQPGPTGTAVNCVSAAGAFDMIGNAWEWSDGVIWEGQYQNDPLPDSGYVIGSNGEGLAGLTRPNEPNQNYRGDYFWIKKQGIRAIALGGYWDNKAKAGQYCAYLVSLPSFANEAVGFRCAK